MNRMIEREECPAEEEVAAHRLIGAILDELNNSNVSISVIASVLATCLAKVLVTLDPEHAEDAIQDLPQYLREAVRREMKIGSKH
jgi:hypothetical protein